MNLRMLSLKKLKLAEFRIAGSDLFHSNMVDIRKVFPKKFCLVFINRGIISILKFLIPTTMLKGFKT